MLTIDYRKMFCSNGLIDDFVLHGAPQDYLDFAKAIQKVLSSGEKAILDTSEVDKIEISIDEDIEDIEDESEEAPEEEIEELFTSLQNEDNSYLSIADWENRDILRLQGSRVVLEEARRFLVALAKETEGYSYLDEYSDTYGYSRYSPVWRLCLYLD